MLVRIANEPRDYAWGSTSLIPAFLGAAESGEPQAELWLGAHPASVARAGGIGLDRLLAEQGLDQPRILLKLLAAAQPLSLQAHPDAERAAAGFAAEEAAGMPRDAPNRRYRDPNAKPELVVAVTRFEALSGFRPVATSLEVLSELSRLDGRVLPFEAKVRESVPEAVGWMLESGPAAVSVVDGLVDAAARAPERLAMERDTVRRLADCAPGDPAIAIALLLHRVSLAPGEALFLAAGNLHAYLEGLGVELMGPSDNVVRGGLTPKHVDRDELMRILDFTPIDDPRLPSEHLDGATRWVPDAPFELRHVDGSHRVERAGQLILLAGSAARIAIGDDRLELRRGDAAYAADAAGAHIEGDDVWVALAD